jgi:hypothetical protein
MLVGSCLATAAAGLISTFDPQSSPGIWIGYQILAGTAFGLAFQAPVMAAQALAAHEDVATTTAILYCKPSTLFTIPHDPSCEDDHTNINHSLPTPRRRHLRLHRRVHLQQHPDLQPAIQSPRRRPFGGGSRGNQSSGSVSAGDLGADCNVLHGWVEGRVLDGSGSGRLCVVGQLVCALGQYQGEGVDGGGVMGRKTDQVFQECSEVGKWSSF